MKRIIQIIPYRRLIPDGVGDYGSMIATEWKAQNGTETAFLATSPKDFEGECSDGHETHYLKAKSSEALIAGLEALINVSGEVCIILHMSAYGYQKRAVPFWLLKGISNFRQLHPEVFLLSIFHEISAHSWRPWRSSFYLSGLQKKIAKEILRLSDSVVTPCQSYARELAGFERRPETQIRALPVFSTVGTTPNIAQSETLSRLALFGGRAQRHKIFTEYLPALKHLCSEMRVEEIVNIGSKDERFPFVIGGIPVRQMGRLSADDVSQELSRCRYGVITYDATRLGKSTVMACMAAHGLNIVCFDKAIQASEGLENGQHIVITESELSEVQLASLGQAHKAMEHWYNPHCLPAQIPVFEAILAGGL